MTTQTTDFYTSAADLYLGLVDASLTANQRIARFARVWLEETLGAQQDLAGLIKRSIQDARETFTQDGEETPTPFTFINRAGDLARANYFLWTEVGLKAQERFTRLYQTAFEELSAAQGEAAQAAEQGIAAFTRRNGN